MGDQQQRHCDGEFGVLGLVSESLHAKVGAKTAADGCNCQKGGFRDPPRAGFCFQLVYKHNYEADCIDYNQVNVEKFHTVIILLEGDFVKRVLIAILLMGVVLLGGCFAPVAYETMSDQFVPPETAAAGELSMLLPVEAAAVTMEGDGGTIYVCDHYCAMVQTFPSGDLDATLRKVTGYSRDQLPVIERQDGDMKRYECVWTAAGEGGDQVGRAVILEDGGYHYTLSLLTDADSVGELAGEWQNILASVRINIAP